MKFKITENVVGKNGEPYKFTAVLDGKFNEGVIFAGSGNSFAEAIGHCLISNREALDLTVELFDENGVKK